MAVIIPEMTPAEVAGLHGSRAEAAVYEALASGLPGRFTVLHSVGWIVEPERGGRPEEGEADFVILDPSGGLLVVEVKGGTVVRSGGRWSSYGPEGERFDISDPAAQAQRAKHGLLRRLASVLGRDSRGIVAGHAVVFPETIPPPGGGFGLDCPPEICAFSGDMQDLGGRVVQILDYWAGRDGEPLGHEGVQKIIGLTSPILTPRMRLGERLIHEEREFVRLTQEQFRVLDWLSRINRARICGGAGTGKTMLALEKARRLASEGRETLLTCFNRPLADHLAALAEGTDRLSVFNFHGLCVQMAREAGLQLPALTDNPADQNLPPEFFDEELPRLLLSALDMLPDRRFDAVVVDEGQDFPEEWWTHLQLALRDADNDVLYVFYDDNQRIYRPGDAIPLSMPEYPLTQNCRNSRPIHDLAMGYYRGDAFVSDGPAGVPVEYVETTGANTTRRELSRTLHRLTRDEGISLTDIVILTGRGRRTSMLAELRDVGAFRVAPLVDAAPGQVAWETIWRFKGLERPVVILIEMDQVAQLEAVYVAVTRARSHLIVLGEAATLAAIGAGEAPRDWTPPDPGTDLVRGRA